MAVYASAPSYHKASALLLDGRLHEACVFLRNIRLTLPAAAPVADEAERLLTDIDLLLSHFAQGGEDPQRAALLDRDYDRAWRLCEQLYDIECPAAVSSEALPAIVDALLLDPASDAWLNTCFEHIAESHHLSRAHRDLLLQAILDEQLPEYVRATLFAAIALHLMQWFDAELIEELYVFTFDDQPAMLRMQAWVTLVLVAFIHASRIDHLPRLQEQYRLMCETEPKLLYAIQIALLQCREAHNVEQRMHEMFEAFDEDDDPKTASVNAKEFFDFITEGIDLSFNTFTKQAELPFFSLPCTRHHWFEPFSLDQPAMKAIFDAHPKAFPWVRMMMQSVAQSETDKYATVFSMQRIAGGKLMSVIGEKIEKIGLSFENLVPPPAIYVMRNFLHDLYRYCILHPQAKAMRHQVFDRDLKMCLNPWLQPVTADRDALTQVADMLYTKQHWAEAAQVYELLLAPAPASAPQPDAPSATDTAVAPAALDQEALKRAHLRLAYAYLQQQEAGIFPTRALQVLRRCDHLFPGSKRTLRMMADLMHDNQLLLDEQAILHEALTHHPDDVALLTRLGRCLNAQQRYKEAQTALFKADILREGRHQTQRQLALALFGAHDYDRARQYAALAAAHDDTVSTAPDHILCGHLALQLGDTQQALSHYSQAPAADVLFALMHDHALLAEAGVKPLTLDLVRQHLSRPQSEINNKTE